MAEDGDSEWSTTTPSFRFRWDVFLSFRGEDTRHKFTGRLYTELVQNGVRTFFDEDGLLRGHEISPSLVTAIEDSAAAIAVISEKYANSWWCLEELAKIIECRKLLLPVFYEVDPSDVRRQTGPFKEDLRKLEDRFGVEKVLRWRKAMEKAGGIAGWDTKLLDTDFVQCLLLLVILCNNLKRFNAIGGYICISCDCNETLLIQSLLKNILTKLSNTPLGVAKHPVGLNLRLQKLMIMLDVKANGVRVLGFYGMGGVGKTTLAKALYNKLVIHFKRRSLIPNVRENSRLHNGLTSLQSKFLGDLLSSPPPEVNEVRSGIMSIKDVVHKEPVLVVLDDVDDVNQLNALAGGRDWFYEGSRIIITTRDKGVLHENFVTEFYEVKELTFPESLELFSYHAFGREKPSKDLISFSEEVVSLTGRLPLALEVFGSFFFYKRSIREREDALKKLKQIRPGELQDVLELSFCELDIEVKRIFLDIACFFVNMKMKREDAIDIFKGCGFKAEIAMSDLVGKSLIKIIDDNILWMHDQLGDMGRQIVLRESLGDPGKCSRLWDRDKIMTVLKDKKGTRSIEGITLNFEKNCDLSLKNIYWMNFQRWPGLASATAYWKEIYNKSFGDCVENENNVILSTKAFEPMVNLRLLQINHWLQWKGCPLKTLPAEFFRLDLTVLDLSESKMVQIWNRKWWHWHKNKMAKKLLVMNLSDCYYLTHIPDLSMLPLEKLILERCKGLVKIHESIGDMSTLTHLNMKDCSSLEEFPSDVSGLKNLENFILHGCSKLKALPENLSGLKSVRELDIDCTAIVNLPDSIFHLKKLERFSLKNCESLKQLPPTIGKLSSLLELYLDGSSALEEVPDSVGNLTNLEKLSLRRCGLLTSIPDSIGNLKSLIELFLDYTSIEELPASVGLLSHLKMLSVERCRSLSKLPDSIGGLASLKLLRLVGTPITEVPDQIGSLNALEKLELGNCEELRSLPNSIGNLLNLTTLSLDDTIIIELPQSIGMLERLDMLKLNNCKYLRRLPSSIGRMTSLRYCLMKGTVVAELPEEFGMLSSLRILDMAKCSHPEQAQNIGGISEAEDLAAQDNLKPVVLPTSFLNLSLLETLDLSAWKLSGKIPDDFENLTSLNNLNLSHNNFCSLPSSLRGVSLLKKLTLNHCKQLKFLPTLPSSLVYLTVANCTALESVPNLSNLESLQDLDLTNCKKVTDIPGLEYLKSLRRFYTIGCNACSTAVKKGLTKVSLRHIRFLGIPGNQIPDWFVPEIPSFSTQKNRDLKGVIVAVVVSLVQQHQDDFRDKVPGIVDIQLKIFRPNEPAYNDKPKHSTVLDLRGIPDTDEDHLYLCRFHDYNPFVRILKDGDKIQVTMRSPRPLFNGLELKEYGIYLVYENDDDIEDDDVESQESVTERLSKFFGSL
ncbi:hypothetical protein CsSME_00043779 [Camellia sinensis var. sinensis]